MINFPFILTVIVNVLCPMTSYLFFLHNAPLISAISSIRRRTRHSLTFNIRVLESPLASFWKNPKWKSSRITYLKLYKHGFVHILHCLTISLVANLLKVFYFSQVIWLKLFFCSFTNIENKYCWRSFRAASICSSEMYNRMKPHHRTSLEITLPMLLEEKMTTGFVKEEAIS